MKNLYKFLSVGALATAVMLSGCDKNDAKQPTPEAANAVADATIGAYEVLYTGMQPNVLARTTTYTYTIQRTGKAQANGLSHWIIAFPTDCDPELTYQNVLGATVDGTEYTNLAGTEGKGTGCTNAVGGNILKFDNLPSILSDGAKHTYSFTLSGQWGESQRSTWVKFGNKCEQGVITGPGCSTSGPACSLSQGYWFSKPRVIWAGEVEVGGKSYTQADGKLIWKTGTVGKPNYHTNNARKAFLQLATLKLSAAAQLFDASQAPATLLADMATIEDYLSTVDKLTVIVNQTTGATTVNFPANSADNKEAGEAAGRIGEWISNNHCPSEPVLQ
ncbi:hypothetical protein [Hymenobacter arizonensis]|uniref:Lipoprotein n=1 Tax=Hymenobacter arizonensis TaxID=1227077 RepID=A0A1I6B663_HYMAR|nr:hypothetical protein [Hymenobacter arizonensis]SFQ76399.1 hypothetical protein SAMN04515668_4207 [Hymenobacter arizonensis]